jgi:spore maturation protein CgeB
MRPVTIAFFGSSLVSAYWNGAATYYRGIVRSLAELGHRITFYEPDAFGRQAHRDMEDPAWARVVVYSGDDAAELQGCLREASSADVVVKASGVGVFDRMLEREVLDLPGDSLRVFWDVDAPATLDRTWSDETDPFREQVPRYDAIFTYGGGAPVVERYLRLGAARCHPIYNALDPTTHHPAPADPKFESDLSFLGNRLPDREARVEEFFLDAAVRSPSRSFLLGGSGWDDKPMPGNVRYLGHVSTNDHNAFNNTPMAVLNISRESMARDGFSPATRVFEAAGAGACVVTDAWEGIELFLEPGEEALVASSGEEVASILRELDRERAREIGHRARERVLREHTYAHRAEEVDALLEDLLEESRGRVRASVSG